MLGLIRFFINFTIKLGIEEYLSFKKPDRKLLATIIDRIEIDENKNIDIYYKIKPLFEYK